MDAPEAAGAAAMVFVFQACRVAPCGGPPEAMSGLDVLRRAKITNTQNTLHEHHIQPAFEFPAAGLQQARVAKTTSGMNTNRRIIVRVANHRDKVAYPDALRLEDQLCQQLTAQAAPGVYKHQVERVFG